MKLFNVSENFLRGDRPTCDDDLFQLANVMRVKTIISLETGFGCFWDSLFGHGFDEGWKWQNAWHLLWESQPCSNFTPPTPAHTEAIAKLIDSAILVGIVFLHCFSGVDRTGWVTAYWKVTRQGMNPELAWEEAIRMGLHFRFWWWKPAFMEMCKNAS